jgi:hypothetical protein
MGENIRFLAKRPLEGSLLLGLMLQRTGAGSPTASFYRQERGVGCGKGVCSIMAVFHANEVLASGTCLLLGLGEDSCRVI